MKPACTLDGHDKCAAPVGVVDIGSNSVRLLIYDSISRNPASLFNEKVLCGLGRALASTGKLSTESMSSALRALRRFRAIASQVGVDALHVIATAAVRDAANADDFVAKASEICGGPVTILSGKEEAKLAASGVMAGFKEPNGLAGDLGGGSLELMELKKRKLGKLTSLPLGGLRLIDLSGGNIDEAAQHVDAALADISWLKSGKGRPFYAIGGTWRALAKLHMAQESYPLRVTHGYKLSHQKTLDFAQFVMRLSPSSLAGIELISRARRETIPFGALILERLFKHARASELIISSHGVREGLIYNLLSQEDQLADPLLAICADIARLSAKSSHYCQELCDWTDSLFSACGLIETDDQKRLRHAACLLSDIGWRVHPEYRQDHSVSIIAHANLSGVDHAGRAFMALAIYFRYGGSDKHNPPALMELLTAEMLERARILGEAFRLAHTISAGTPGVVYNTPLRLKGKRLVIDLSPPYNILEGARLSRRADALGNLLGREVEVSSSGESATKELSSTVDLPQENP